MTLSDDRRQSAEDLRSLLGWAAGLEASAIPSGTLRRAATILLDDVSAMAAPRDEVELIRFLDRSAKPRGGGESTVFLDARRVSREQAAMANAAACCWCQLDEGYRKTSCHAGLYVLPALLAEAEASDLSVGEVLRALVLAYEVVTRVASTWPRAGSPHHVHAQYSGVGAASAVALVRRLPLEVMMDAVAGAATLSPIGPLVQMVDGGLVSNFYAAVGARAGMQSVDWAEIGIGGLGNALHDVFGASRGGTFRPGQLCADLGQVWSVNFGFHKRYAACQRLHAGADAVVELVRALPDHERGRRIRRMVIKTHDFQLAGMEPLNSLATRFSFPHALAAMVVLGHGEASAFSGATLVDPDIVALRRKVEVVPYDPPLAWPQDRAVTVSITMDDGGLFQKECRVAHGSPDDPLSEPEILDKARALSSPAFPMLVPVLQELMEAPAKAAKVAWRSVVSRITSRPSAAVTR